MKPTLVLIITLLLAPLAALHAADESIQIPTGAEVQTATTHPMKYYISLPKN